MQRGEGGGGEAQKGRGRPGLRRCSSPGEQASKLFGCGKFCSALLSAAAFAIANSTEGALGESRFLRTIATIDRHALFFGHRLTGNTDRITGIPSYYYYYNT